MYVLHTHTHTRTHTHAHTHITFYMLLQAFHRKLTGAGEQQRHEDAELLRAARDGDWRQV